VQTKTLEKPKAPTENLDFVFDFTNELSAGDTVTAATVTVVPDGGLTLGTKTVVTPKVTQWASGGSPFAAPHLICEATTAQGRHHVMVWVVPIGYP
jgi:hypothetical protein